MSPSLDPSRPPRERLVAALDALLARADVELVLGGEGGAPGPGTRIHPHARLTALLRGRHDVGCRVAGEPRSVALAPGRWIWLAPQAWFRPDFGRDHVLVSVVVQPARLRLVINDHAAARGHRPPRCWYHLPLAADAPLRAVASALDRLVVQAPDSAAAPHLVRSLLELALAALRAPPAPRPVGGAATWRAIEDYLAEHCQDAIDRNLVARVFELHPGHVSRLAGRHGEGFNATLTRLRLARAAELLRSSEASVADIAAGCGYASVAHFVRRFARAYGTTPGRYRKEVPARPGG